MSCLLAVSLMVALACGPAADARELPGDDLSLHAYATASSASSTAVTTSDFLNAIKNITDVSTELQCAPVASHEFCTHIIVSYAALVVPRCCCPDAPPSAV